jgi:hypothetical protein
VVKAETVAWRRTREGIAAAMRCRRAALRRKATAAIRGSGLKTARRGVNGGGDWRRRRGRQWHSRGDGGRRGASRVVEEISRGGEVPREQFAAVSQGSPHGFGQTTKIDGIEQDIGIVREQRVHLGKECRRAAVAERAHVQNTEAALKRRGGEAGEEGLLEEQIRLRGSGGDPTGKVTYGSQHLRGQSTNNVDVTDVGVGG